MKRFVLFLGLLLNLPAALAAGNLADVQIRDRASGRVLPVYQSDGRWFVAGRPGREFRIEFRNRDARDLLAVISVDGVNVVTGETAASSQGGYVVNAGGSLSISGWRKSLDNVAAFYFTNIEDSYAARTGRPENVGVIGVAVFRRKAEPEPLADLAPQAPMGSAMERDASRGARAESSAAQKSLGTGHGRVESSQARYVEFERESESPSEVIAIHYDTHANLVARGVIRGKRTWPAPFPGGFVADPPSRG
ncbi:MAG: hypothetical protein ACKVP2_11425 [Burkholderiales bacterium]